MHHCKFCQSTDVFRIPRHGFFQTRIYILFGLFPWECPHCRHISILASRGKNRRLYRASNAAKPEQHVVSPHTIQMRSLKK